MKVEKIRHGALLPSPVAIRKGYRIQARVLPSHNRPGTNENGGDDREYGEDHTFHGASFCGTRTFETRILRQAILIGRIVFAKESVEQNIRAPLR